MSIFTRLSNGWTLSMNSLRVLKENKQLIIFPLLSGVSMVLIIGSFVVALLASAGWDFQYINDENTAANYIIGFAFYLVNYFVVAFFNTALIQCTRDYFNGEEPSVKKGLQFAWSRVGAIFSWSVFAATIGFGLKLLQENLGTVGKIITGIIGVVWSIATFFVVPIIAYENLGPIQAFKRSTQIMKEKWGESLASNFSFGLLRFIGVILCIVVFGLLAFVNPIFGLVIFLLSLFFVLAISSAAQTIFISAVYHNLNGDPVKNFNEKFAENLFRAK